MKALLPPLPQHPVRLALATNLTTVGVLTRDHSAPARDDGNVVVHIQDVDGDGDVTHHPRVIWRVISQ